MQTGKVFGLDTSRTCFDCTNFYFVIDRLKAQNNISGRTIHVVDKGLNCAKNITFSKQNGSYINRIENKLAFPSMQAFFYICEYLGISSAEFFDDSAVNPIKWNAAAAELKKLTDSQLDLIISIAKELQK